MMKKEFLSFKEIEGSKFFYLDIGSEVHGRKSFRLWIAGRLVKREEDEWNGKKYERFYVEFPLKGARIEKTEKGNLVLRSADGWVTYDVYVPCGYRGGSEVEILEPEDRIELDYFVYRSPRGNLGISHGKLVSAKSRSIKFRWKRSGRLYGSSPQGITVLYEDGKEEVLEDLPDGLEALSELKEKLG